RAVPALMPALAGVRPSVHMSVDAARTSACATGQPCYHAAMRCVFTFPAMLLFCSVAAYSAEPAVDWEKLKPETLQHYQSLIRINTSAPPGNETAAVNYLKAVFDREGIGYQVFAQDPSRANLVARLKGNGSRKPILV